MTRSEPGQAVTGMSSAPVAPAWTPHAPVRPDPWRAPEAPAGAGRRSRLALLVVALLLLTAVATGTGMALRPQVAPGTGVAWVGAVADRVAAVQAVLDRRAAAVRARDRDAFMADVDRADTDFVRRQEVTYENLVRLPLGEFSYHVEPAVSYPKMIIERFVIRFHTMVYAPGVTVRYSITGVDSRPVTTPWVPVFGRVGGRWVIAGEASDKHLPYGTNGQPWDAGLIKVVTSKRVVVAFSDEDAGRADYLLQLAERGLDRVRAVRPAGWDGKVLVTAVQDRRIFDTYFAGSPDRVAQVAAIAVPYYDRVLDWSPDATFAATRVVFNPQQLSAQPEELLHDLAHEFAHAAMGPVTSERTPRWLVEGFAEYVAYKPESVPTATVRRALRGVSLDSELPGDSVFYSEPANYVTSWLACKMIADRYGEARLVALYEAFREADGATGTAGQEEAVHRVLGVNLAVLTGQWRSYVQKRAGS